MASAFMASFFPRGWFPANRSDAGASSLCFCRSSPWWTFCRIEVGRSRFNKFACRITYFTDRERMWCCFPLAGRGGEERRSRHCSSSRSVKWLAGYRVSWSWFVLAFERGAGRRLRCISGRLSWWKPKQERFGVSSFIKRCFLGFCCISFFDLHPLASGMCPEFDGRLVLFTCRREARCGISGAEDFVSLCRSGCEKKDWRFCSGFSRGFLTAINGVHQRRRACVAVTHGRRSHSVLWRCVCHGVFNLQLRRPFLSSAVAINVVPSPSGFVPGDGADGRCVELLNLGGKGSNCISNSLGMVLFVKSKDLVVIFLFFMVLDVICTSTD